MKLVQAGSGGYKRDAAMGRNKRRHANARAEVPSGGVQKWGLRQVDRKLSIRVYMTVKQWGQRTAIVGIEAFPQAIPFDGALDQNCVDQHKAVLQEL